jgi:hypothetical protein
MKNTQTDVKNLNDDDLMEYYDYLTNMKEPNPDNEDARQDSIKRAEKELLQRGFR